MADVGGNLEQIIKEKMDEGCQPRVVYDNFDFRIKPGQLTRDHQNTDNHWISQYVTFDSNGTLFEISTNPYPIPDSLFSRNTTFLPLISFLVF